MSSASSPFSSRLDTNYCPKDEEIFEIQGLLVEPLSRLKRLDDEIADLQRAIEELTEERESLATYVDEHRALISPVRRLPLDIIQEIFVACIPTHRNCVMSAQEAPVLLGRICSSWRTISLLTPRLWARLHIAEPTRFEAFGVAPTGRYHQKLVQRLEITKTWLGRSGQCPLSISFDSGQEHPGLPNGPPASGFPNTYLFLQAMISFASRWQNITLSVSWSALNTLSNLTESDVPMLTKLDINQRTEAVTPNIEWSSFGLFRAPTLNNFALAGAEVRILDFPMRWGNLTSLAIMGHGWGVFTCGMALEVLSNCPQVRVCRLLVNEDPSATVTDGSGISTVLELPHLHSFYLTSIGLPLDNIGSILRRLSVPALRHFDLRGRSNIGDQHPTFVSSFVAFLGTSQRCESLRIDTQLFKKQSLIELLRGLPPTLKQLRITDRLHSWVIDGMKGVLDDDALAVLTPSPPELPVSCPVLEELHITHCTSPSDAALLRFITMRMAVQPVTLKRVEIQFSREMDVDIQADIEPFVDAGLRVSTRYHHTPAAGNFSPWQGLPDAPGMWPVID